MAHNQRNRIKATRNIRAEKLRRDQRNVSLEPIRHCLCILDSCENSLSYLRSMFHADTNLDDVVFVALDTEADDQNIRGIGFSLLDTRDLKYVTPGADLSTVILSYNYITRQSKGRVQWKQAIQIRHFETYRRARVPWLNKALRTGSPTPDSSSEERNVIPISHCIGTDFQSLEKICFELDPDIKVPVIDTSYLCREVFNIEKTPALVDLVEWLGISHEHVALHNTGNDANLTLKVLLKLGMKICSDAEAQMH
ncbi:uncharacterized protein PAC_16161 [Phialocephala subalpina]|uniref:Gfd2/YDR514C-like C-terminal domain-containing protein n=1 Tax=Phialocephala subalpina TaxID=576137 RepID=A0A1L7XMI3_9HELO|nr:uncharacterized protein PAC_16161 [Phialocephala subalpina]